MIEKELMNRRVVHLIIGLGKGGAESTLYNTIKYRSSDSKYGLIVISMGEGSYFAEKLRNQDITVHELDLRHHPIRTFYQIRKIIKKDDILCCWMYHANVIGYFAGINKYKKLIWNIRHSDVEKKHSTRISWLFMKSGALLSKKPSVIAFNGYKALRNHEKIGYNIERSIVLDNGCDLEEFSYIDGSKERILKQFSLPNDTIIVLSVARYHPDKDIPTFLRAFVRIKRTYPNAIALMCGNKIEYTNSELKAQINQLGLMANTDVFLLGQRDDLPFYFSGADIYILHSASEAFPNTLIQAMACECVVLSTKVGEVERIINNEDYLVSVGDDEALAQKIESILYMTEQKRKSIGVNNRTIVKKKYNIHKIVKEYEKLFD